MIVVKKISGTSAETNEPGIQTVLQEGDILNFYVDDQTMSITRPELFKDGCGIRFSLFKGHSDDKTIARTSKNPEDVMNTAELIATLYGLFARFHNDVREPVKGILKIELYKIDK